MLTVDTMIDSVMEIPAKEHNVSRINTLAEKTSPYAHLRQDSKTPTFLFTYGGTWMGVVGQLSWPKDKAQKVEARYHDLYQASDAWVSEKLDQATRDGYITAAFGLRVRTPLLAQVIRSTSKTPHEAEAEGRTAGNALGQSWCLLNSRAASDFMGTVRTGKYRLDIRPCAQIHDAQYYLIRDDIDLVLYVNHHLVEAVFWQDHPDIAHDTVTLGGELSIFYPNWAHEIVLPNGATEEEVRSKVAAHMEKLSQKP